MEAALEGARQIGFTLVSLTVSLIAVLIPLLFMADVVGRLFREFAITLAVSILISLVVSLTLTPMMCARLLKAEASEKHGRLFTMTGKFFDGMIALYGRLLNVALRYQTLTLFVAVATLALTVWLYIVVPKGFFPVQDTGAIQVITEAPQSVSFAAMAERQRAAARAILEEPDVKGLSSFIGVDGANATLNSGRMLVTLTPRDDRDRSATEIIAALRERVARVPGITLYMQPVQDLTIEDRVSRTQFQFTLEDPDAARLGLWVPKLVERLQQSPYLADVASDLQDRGLQAFLDIDRDAASRLGIRVAAIDDALYDAFGQRLISTIYTQANQYRVVLEVAPRFQIGPEALGQVFVATSDGRQIPLSNIATIEDRNTALVINHAGQFPAVTMSFNLAEGASLGRAVEAIEQAQRELGMPASIQTTFQGAAAAFRSSLDSTLLLVLAAIVTMYLVLGVLYESYIHPITILSTLPSAGVGALLALLITDTDLSLIAVIGIILLIGIVKKNAIMMIDFALDAERTEGLSPRDAIYKAALLRFRPILMTTLAALFGALAADAVVRFRRRDAPAARPGDGRRPARESGAHAVHHAGDLPLLRPPRARVADRAAAARGGGRHGMSLSSPFISRPVATTLLSISVVLVGALGYMLLPVSPLPQVDFPAISVGGVAARREPGDDGLDRGDAARACPRDHRRRQRDQLAELAGLHAHQPPVRPRQEHRHRRARGAGGHQRLALAAAECAAGHAVVPQDQPVAGADHAAGAHLRHGLHQSALRPGLDRAGAEGRAGHRRRRRDGRWRVPAGRPRRTAAAGPHAVRHLARPGPPGHQQRQPAAAQGHGRGQRPALADSRQ